jgi:hypothetical protein
MSIDSISADVSAAGGGSTDVRAIVSAGRMRNRVTGAGETTAV